MSSVSIRAGRFGMPRGEICVMIVRAICSSGGSARFSDIVRFVLNRGSFDRHRIRQRIYYHLKRMCTRGILVRKSKGIYELNTIAPFCLIGLEYPHFSYIGGLGRRLGREEPEPLVATNKLEEELSKKFSGFRFARKIIITTPEASDEWRDIIDKLSGMGFEFIMVSSSTLVDIRKMGDYLTSIVDRLKAGSIPIIDCTSLTKIYTIAAIEVATRECLPVIYIYEDTGELYWLIGIDEAMRRAIKKLLDLIQ